MNDAMKTEILSRYRKHVDRFERDATACRRRGTTLVADAPIEPQPREVELSERELSVLEHIAGGLTDQEIGRAVGISEFTVKTHLRRLYGKLAARNRAHAVARGLAAGHLTA
jgi:ATP/maltotriose-dependent transcriptional regulator MalT